MRRRLTGFAGAGLALLIALTLPIQQTLACTSFLLKAADGGFVYGRTLEFSLPLNSSMLVMPRNFPYAGTGPGGQAAGGLPWVTKYGVAGANAFGMPVFVDGVNEAGLAGGMLYLPGLAQYQDVPPSEASTSIAAHEVLTYILTNFASVAEVKEGLPKIRVNKAIVTQLRMPAPMHVTVHDASGASLVIEYIGGQLQLHDNPTTVMTNAPAFDWQIANLGNYLALSRYNPEPLKVGSLTISPPSTGAGAPGLPGDMSSPSRFVRAFMYARAAPVLETGAQTVNLAFHILNNFDLPPGMVRTKADSQSGGGVTGIEITEWTSVIDLKARRYYIRTYENSQIQVLDLATAPLDGKTLKMFPLTRPASTVSILD
ncbi:linear amide C-N hydrolase [Camelimonas sp. ID_303_24]